MRRIFSAGIALSALTLVLASTQAAHAQFNVDFSAGLGGGTTAYNLTSSPSSATPTGSYQITNSVTTFNPLLTQPTGATTSGGNFLVFDGSTVAGTNLFSFSTLVSNTGTYNFSFFGASGGSLSPVLAASFGVGSTAPNTTTALGSLATTGAFQRFTSANFLLTAGTTYTFTILDTNTVGGGNDGAIDDVRLSQVVSTTAPEPGSLALLLPVMGTIGMVLRRRRK